MNFRYTLIPVTILLLTFLGVQNVSAQKVYRWTDEEGIVHYSDVPPMDREISETQEINLGVFNQNNADPEMYSIINQADRMAERRRQDTEERLAIKRLQLEEKRLANELELSQFNEIISAQEYQPQTNYYHPILQYYTYPYSGHHYKSHGNTHHQQKRTHHSRKSHRAGFSPNLLHSDTHHSKSGLHFSSF